MSDQQAYAGQADRSSGTSEWNRLNAAIRSVMNQMATMTLVRVEAVNGRTVDIRPIVAQLDGAGNAVDHGTIHNVPVWCYQAGGAAVEIKPVVGDIGMAVFAHSDISAAKANGAASPPGSRRRFDWADAVYLGGLFGDEPTTTITLSATDGVQITSNRPVVVNASAGIDLRGPTKVTGGLTVDGIVFATHKHTLVQAGTANSGPVAPNP